MYVYMLVAPNFITDQLDFLSYPRFYVDECLYEVVPTLFLKITKNESC